jgi:hypothetical protein
VFTLKSQDAAVGLFILQEIHHTYLLYKSVGAPRRGHCGKVAIRELKSNHHSMLVEKTPPPAPLRVPSLLTANAPQQIPNASLSAAIPRASGAKLLYNGRHLTS